MGALMIVYRVENKNGEGPYFNQFSLDGPSLEWGRSINSLHGDCPNHPAPSDDIKAEGFDRYSGEWYYGFTTMEALEKWFNTPEPLKLEMLLAAGYLVRQFECEPEDVKPGNIQCAFKRKKARML